MCLSDDDTKAENIISCLIRVYARSQPSASRAQVKLTLFHPPHCKLGRISFFFQLYQGVRVASFLPLLHSQAVADFVFLAHDMQRHGFPDTEQHEQGPLPAEGIDDDGEEEPVQELAVCEEVESASIALLALPDSKT